MTTTEQATGDGAAGTAPDPATEPTPVAGTPRRRVERSTRTALIIIGVVALLAAVGFTLSYVLDAGRHVSTDNAGRREAESRSCRPRAARWSGGAARPAW